MLIPTNFELYRYDTKEPPLQWSNDFHEYDYPMIGYKNIIGAFFFYDNKETAIQTGSNEPKNTSNTVLLTHCKTIKETKLLDLRFASMIGMLAKVREAAINIFDLGMCTYFRGHAVSLSAVAEDYAEYNALASIDQKTNKELERQTNLIYQIVRFIEPRNQDASFRGLGQLLTDFSNGPIFNRELQRKGYDGYVFYEHDINDPIVTTYCFLESKYLSKPQRKRITI